MLILVNYYSRFSLDFFPSIIFKKYFNPCLCVVWGKMMLSVMYFCQSVTPYYKYLYKIICGLRTPITNHTSIEKQVVNLKLRGFLVITVRNEVVKVMFLHLSVCPQGEVCLSACWDTTKPLEQAPPLGAGTPRSRYPPGAGKSSWEQAPLGTGTCKQAPPRAGTPREQAPPPPGEQATPLGSRHHPREQAPPWQQAPPWEQAPTPLPRASNPLQETATVADGTHPTGMHFCIVCCVWSLCLWKLMLQKINARIEKTNVENFTRKKICAMTVSKLKHNSQRD